MKINHKEISIIGGAGHVGFPLGLVFATKKYKVNLIDKNRTFLNKIDRGIPPFLEKLPLANFCQSQFQFSL